jgi:DNA adenine methylase
MKPLIKWAGGKSREIKHIENMIPSFKRYIEPFFGGGAVFFDLEPKKSIINDISEELVLFYQLLKTGHKNDKFKLELYKYVSAWEKINVYMENFGDSFINLYEKYKMNRLSFNKLSFSIDKLFKNEIIPFNGLFKSEFCINQINLMSKIKENLLAKLYRTKVKIDTKNKFSNEDIKINIESAFRSGLYMHFRDIMNQTKNSKLFISQEKKIANWYFIREFCYGGMFRYNSKGAFNVPYGGIAYNNKNFRLKVDYIFSNEVKNLLNETQIYNKDFEELLGTLNLCSDDFIFLDPPYDSEFSEYEKNAFTRKDQERLANVLKHIKASWILVIKETKFIKELYEDEKGIKIERFNKEYLFNIKERNNRDVQHLIVHNMNLSKSSVLSMAGTLAINY